MVASSEMMHTNLATTKREKARHTTTRFFLRE
jgi:hypothetical protein